MTSRIASHAGSWYTEDPKALSAELDRFLERVPNTIEAHPIPVPGARVIIAP
jgi:predicted class III extradiol MEMO1 family dioxygenase